MPSRKRRKHRPGLNSHGIVSTSTRTRFGSWMIVTNMYLLCFQIWKKRQIVFANNKKRGTIVTSLRDLDDRCARTMDDRPFGTRTMDETTDYFSYRVGLIPMSFFNRPFFSCCVHRPSEAVVPSSLVSLKAKRSSFGSFILPSCRTSSERSVLSF